jgi:hypothetical protein
LLGEPVDRDTCGRQGVIPSHFVRINMHGYETGRNITLDVLGSLFPQVPVERF